MPKTSTTAMDAARQLLAGAPSDRAAWLIEHQVTHPRRVAELIMAVEDVMGTPYGLWHDDPVGFITFGLGESVWAGQREIAQSVNDHERTIVPSCHSAGKTYIAARIVAWWICCHAYGTAQVITTATRWRQVRGLLWLSATGIRTLHARAKLPGKCLQTEWQLQGTIVAQGFSPADRDETAFSGYHAPNLLIVVDEAGGLSAVLGRSLESVMSSGNARLLAIGNPPVDDTGSTWMEDRCASPNYNVIRIPAERTPNFTGELTPLCKLHPEAPAHTIGSHLIDRGWVDSVVTDEGIESPYYIARVLAQFPKDVTAKTIPRSWLDEAQVNENPEAMARISLGVDVAADGGDRFAIARADGMTIQIVHSKRPPQGVRTFDLAGTVLEKIEEAERLRAERGINAPIRVKVDALGIGMGVTDTLRAWGEEGLHDAEIVAVKVSESCTDPLAAERYANQRAEMWWLGRLLSQEDPNTGAPAWRLDVEDRVLVQLNAPTYTRNSSGRLVIEGKDKMKKRGIHSPDDAEAVLLAVYEPEAFGDAVVESAAGMPLPGPGRR